MNYTELTTEELLNLKIRLDAQYEFLKALNLKLDMSRGKPSNDQLKLSMDMLNILQREDDIFSEENIDCRNYGVLDGLKEAKQLIADLTEVKPEQVFVAGNGSLNLMYTLIAHAWIHGIDGALPWGKQEKIKFLCPVPGYDRHFKITESFNIEMINIPMSKSGPDMDLVEKYVNEDPTVKGIWCVPKYSNPDGYTYSDTVVRRMAALKPAASDFRIFWDNAYIVHHLDFDNPDMLLNIFEECKKNKNIDILYGFVSTSKMTFPGSGIAAFIASEKNIAEMKKYMATETIGFDKLNQLRHVRFFKDRRGIEEHMKKHASIVRKRFQIVLKRFEELGECGIASWTNPKGGYFISLYTLGGCAKRTVELCKDAGVILTDAGAAYPYGKDPKDSHIRIAPTFPSIEDLQKATEAMVLCAKLAAVEKLLAELA